MNRDGLKTREWRMPGTVSGCVIVASLIIGCRTMPSESVGAFSAGVSSAHAQTTLAFQGVADLASAAIIDYAATQPTLCDEDFVVVLDSESVAAWERVLSILEEYSHHLARLASDNRTKEYQNSSVELARRLLETGKQLQSVPLAARTPEVSASIATGLIEIGEWLLKAGAQAEARRIVTQTDPALGKILAGMAATIGTGQDAGIRGTAFQHWEQIKGRTKVDFVKAVAERDEARRHVLAAQYARQMTRQRTQDLMLASLRRSFLALADAHHALAHGNDLAAAATLATLREEQGDTRHFYDKPTVGTEDEKK